MFVKAQLTSLSASLIDFSTTVFLVKVCGADKLYAGMAGVIAGGIFHFTVSRRWVFDAIDRNRYLQIAKYILVWLGNFVLNAGGLFILLNYTHINYIISKIVVSVTVGICYNYLLQKRFVFK